MFCLLAVTSFILWSNVGTRRQEMYRDLLLDHNSFGPVRFQGDGQTVENAICALSSDIVSLTLFPLNLLQLVMEVRKLTEKHSRDVDVT